MNRRSQAQWAVSGVVEAPVKQVWAALLDANPVLSAADKSAIALHNGSQPFTTSIGKPLEGKISIEVDTQHHSIAVQGEWWYRGVHAVESHERGSLLVYRVYNIAPGIGWWAAQLVQGPQHARRMGEGLQSLLHTIGEQLGCDAELQVDRYTGRRPLYTYLPVSLFPYFPLILRLKEQINQPVAIHL